MCICWVKRPPRASVNVSFGEYDVNVCLGEYDVDMCLEEYDVDVCLGEYDVDVCACICTSMCDFM